MSVMTDLNNEHARIIAQATEALDKIVADLGKAANKHNDVAAACDSINDVSDKLEAESLILVPHAALVPATHDTPRRLNKRRGADASTLMTDPLGQRPNPPAQEKDKNVQRVEIVKEDVKGSQFQPVKVPSDAIEPNAGAGSREVPYDSRPQPDSGFSQTRDYS